LFFVADRELSIPEHFTDHGGKLSGLGKKLRGEGVTTFDSFSKYGDDFRRRLGIASKQALELFNQTVSMKDVANLDDFVRTFMLEPDPKTATQVDKIVEHFEDLTKAHEAVLRARAQLEQLDPLMSLLDQYEKGSAAILGMDAMLAATPVYFADRVCNLAVERAGELTELIEGITAGLEASAITANELRGTEAQLEQQVKGNGGDRLEYIASERSRWEQTEGERHETFIRFNGHLVDADLTPVETEAQFVTARTESTARQGSLEEQSAKITSALIGQGVSGRELEAAGEKISTELQSLSGRQSNLPASYLELRDKMCSELGLEPASLPFAGELLQVREDCLEWEGAAERVLRGFALSMLVPDQVHERVASWINGHHLNTLLEHHRVPSHVAQPPSRHTPQVELRLADMVEVKTDSPFADWLHQAVQRLADHICVDSVTEARRHRKAVTREGQVKSQDRYRKDDRSRIDDRRRFVLGWSNAAKVEVLIALGATNTAESAAVQQAIRTLKQAKDATDKQVRAISIIGEFQRWEHLNWAGAVERIALLDAEEQSIRSSSDKLQVLTAKLDEVRKHIDSLTKSANEQVRRQGGLEEKLKQAQQQLSEGQEILAASTAADAAGQFPAIEAVASKLGLPVNDMESLPRSRTKLTENLNAQRLQQDQTRNKVVVLAQRRMSAFCVEWPQETAELDDSIEAAGEYRAFHERVKNDDLPRFEREFKECLNQNTIRDIAGFAAQLDAQEAVIKERVQVINDALHQIDYNEGRYIRLVLDRTTNTEVRQFRADLHECTSSVTGTEAGQYAEDRFLKVKLIIDRFKGREGFSDTDKAWTRRVTDVRQRFVFAASERWRHDDVEHENYKDSGAKSGGQKEKLAYTVLAASLAYQFKLMGGPSESAAFRFVVIDEAFARGSDISTSYALELFTKLGLQLLIVTPLQKFQAIEPHVSFVGFVQNVNGNNSELRRLTIEEVQQLRENRHEPPAR
jgi:uncharacterized protein YPO0396